MEVKTGEEPVTRFRMSFSCFEDDAVARVSLEAPAPANHLICKRARRSSAPEASQFGILSNVLQVC